jgi:DNA polymerase-3 subunit epsilon
LVRDEVPNCRLGTLADRLRLDHRPTHRALDDVLATVDLLHLLLERAAGLGVTGLDDLLGLPKMGGHPQARKLALTTDLPRDPGVYLFRDRTGRVLYVGKAANLRQRVRSYFSSDDRRKVGSLLREAHRLDHEVCANPLEAAVREVRLIHEHQPRYNRQAKDWSRYRWVKLTLHEPWPRLSVVRLPKDDGAVYVGPVSSTAVARRVVDAVHTVVPLRRCTQRPSSAPGQVPCTPAQLGVSLCPCAGTVSRPEYAAVVEQARVGLCDDPTLLLEPLRRRMDALAAAERFEEAADTRDRAASLAGALRQQRRLESLWRADQLVVDVPGQGGAQLARGRLVRAWSATTTAAEQLRFDTAAFTAADPDEPDDPGPIPAELVDELTCVARWLEGVAPRARVLRCSGELASALPALPSFAPGKG